ncbi:tellurium resistance protein TerA [Streptomyces sp. NPDC051018]|uniref:tellurium resistance protein TerA n=1 Tax=Streptomyces sp. NPDC051018 TaxID=3365639 RepID=UPI00379BA900
MGDDRPRGVIRLGAGNRGTDGPPDSRPDGTSGSASESATGRTPGRTPGTPGRAPEPASGDPAPEPASGRTPGGPAGGPGGEPAGRDGGLRGRDRAAAERGDGSRGSERRSGRAEGGRSGPYGQRQKPRSLLTRGSPAVRLTGRGVLQVNLNWPPGHDADLDLGALIEFTDGGTAVVQALGDDYGSLTSWPYAALDQDDRTGGASDGETLRVSMEHRALFRRLLIFAYVYEGAVDFRRLGATAEITGPDRSGGSHRILLDDSPPGAVACAIARVTAEGDGLTMLREVRWFTASQESLIQQQIDRAYGYGMTWVPMTKPPR